MTKDKRISGEEITGLLTVASKKPKKVIWHSVDLLVRYSITFNEYQSVIHNIISECTNGDGDCVLPLLDCATKAYIIGAYANVELPNDSENLYSIIYGTDLYDVVFRNANQNQIKSIIQSVLWCAGVGGGLYE